jgi:hypothetical protein
VNLRSLLVPAALLLALLAAAPAGAADPGRWSEVRKSPIPIFYYQGVAADPKKSFYFDGIAVGLYRTDSSLKETAKTDNVIPGDVSTREGYNHIGDIAFDTREGGRVLLPMECYVPKGPNGGNTCGTGSIAVADPKTLTWRYYVKLDPQFIKKAMWCEVSPDGQFLWTQQGDDLLAYAMSDIVKANEAPSGKQLRPVKTLTNAVPPSGITGAAFVDDRLYVAGAQDSTYQVWSIDVRDGSRRLEIERQVFGESEGLVSVDAFGGVLHWIITPIDSEGRPATYGGNVLISFKANPGVRPAQSLSIEASKTTVTAGKRTKFRFLVKRTVGSLTLPAAGAKVGFAGKTLTADDQGRASVTLTFAKAGTQSAVARLTGARTAKARIKVQAAKKRKR